jgi:uncharacterized membrane protein YeaQ/YmgE (transglycosylase-associated protein family)
MAIVMMLVVGLVIGVVAKLLMPGRDPGGILATIALGIAGAVGAGLVGHEMGWYANGQRAGLVASVLGAIVLLALYRAFLGARARRAG